MAQSKEASSSAGDLVPPLVWEYPLENSMDRGAWWLQFMGSKRVGHD